MTVIKVADDKQPALDALTALLERPDVDPPTRKSIEDEIWSIRAGVQGEREAAYEIDFYYAAKSNHVVIHDLRLEFGGRVAQIDHMLINRVLDIWVCETKAFSQGVKIDDHGEWYRYGGKFARGMPSPVKQNARHVEVLRDIFDKGAVRLPRRLGVVTLKPTFHPVVLVSNGARIDRPKSKKARLAIDGLETVIKVEQLLDTINRRFDERNPLPLMAKLVGVGAITDIARQLIELHRPASFDWASKFGVSAIKKSAAAEAAEGPAEPPSAGSEAPGVCATCGKAVSDRVAAYSLEHADEFGGSVLCWDCQRAAKRGSKRAS